jgi:hypothetical protein
MNFVHVTGLFATRDAANETASTLLRSFWLEMVRLRRMDGTLLWMVSGTVYCNSLNALLAGRPQTDVPGVAVTGSASELVALAERGVSDYLIDDPLDAATAQGIGLSLPAGLATDELVRDTLLLSLHAQDRSKAGIAGFELPLGKYEIRPWALKRSLTGLRDITDVARNRVGFRACRSDLLRLVIGLDKSGRCAVWDQDQGGQPTVIFDDSAAGADEAHRYVFDEELRPLLEEARVEGPAAVALVESDRVGPYALLACVGGGGARGVWFCQPGNVADRLLIGPGCAFHLSKRRAAESGLAGEDLPSHSMHDTFPWGSWESFLQLAGAQLVGRPHLSWETLDVPPGTRLPELTRLASATVRP